MVSRRSRVFLGAEVVKSAWRNDRFWWRRPVSQAAVSAYGVEVTLPCLDKDLGFPEGVQHLSVQEFVAQRPLEAARD